MFKNENGCIIIGIKYFKQMILILYFKIDYKCKEDF